MHYHLEIILPPTEDVKAAVERALEAYDENHENKEEGWNKYAFWDYWVIGGRYSGSKVQALYPQEAMDAFYAELKEKKVTVSTVTWGKQTLEPASQIPMVNAIWQKHFPSGGTVCPVFDHYNKRFGDGSYKPSDICTLKDIPANLSASRVMLVSGDPEYNGKRITFMVEDSVWNGVSWIDTKWDGKVSSALEMARALIKNYRDEYKEKVIPKDDWLCVTVDYHS